MKIETKYDIGQTVWDTLTKTKITVIGIKFQKGKMCCKDEDIDTLMYIIDNHLCDTYRFEHELQPIN